ncbi:nitrate- and nitrite sensing domain-containing protein [Streptomyces sp. NPDC051940]|uniref:sensor histidine kinase n=1 Tax=Streptomyces sp. NPDC051940 TaxID=3155675 RepID=UPI0034347A7A
MRRHGKSIRRTMVALLIVPLASLTAIWIFTTVLTGREAARLFAAPPLVDKLTYPTEDVVQAVQAERRQALVLLADPMDKTAPGRYRELQRHTDDTVKALLANAGAQDVREHLGTESTALLNGTLSALGGLDTLRNGVEKGNTARGTAFSAYNQLIDPCYTFLGTLRTVDDVELDRQSRALTVLGRAREAVAREDALLTAAVVSGRMGDAELRDFERYVQERELLYAVSLPMLPEEDQEAYERFWQGPEATALRDQEQAAVIVGASEAPGRTDAAEWTRAAGAVLDGTAELGVQSADRHEQRVEPRASRVLTEAAIAGLLGLLAVTVSILLPVRIGRRLVRDLSALRRHARTAAEVQLPRVQRRLAAGERIDVEAEVPRPAPAGGEIGQVEQAVSTLQRAAVEGAVKQAEMRQAVGEVFVNLARRSQALLHRQLSLLDEMERRTKDSAELADLFRLDHLTTRMRRHAEGLVILSGAAPSRQWRRPVPLLDVVRAAIAEVEDYERIEVRALPPAFVQGHAVAGLVHLLAELMENATVFSPPSAPVEVGGAADGTVRITDRGLGMSDESLLQANLRLAETPEFSLTDTDRLGLFVVSRLARRLGLRVTLERARGDGGISALVRIPAELLTDDGEPPVHRRPDARIPEQRAPRVPRQPGEEHEFAPDRTVRLRPSARRTRVPAAAPAPSPAPSPAPAPTPAPAGAPAPLPRRAPRPEGGGQVKAAQVADRRPGADERDADEARSTMAAIQSGWRRGRADNASAERRQDSRTPQSPTAGPTQHTPEGDRT